MSGWDNGLNQDYNRQLGAWFANRIDARYTLRKVFEMDGAELILTSAEKMVKEGWATEFETYAVTLIRRQEAEINHLKAESNEMALIGIRSVADIIELRKEVQQLRKALGINDD